MPLTKIQIWNQALSHVGVRSFVQSSTENSNEASVLSIWWDSAIEYVLAEPSVNWPFALRYASLAQVSLAGKRANNEWAYSYRYPTDCIAARRIINPSVGRVDPNPPPFTVGSDDVGKLIFTDQHQAELAYTKRVIEPEKFDEKFSECLGWYLAAKIATPLSRINNMTQWAERQYARCLASAGAKVLNEQQQDQLIDAENIQARI